MASDSSLEWLPSATAFAERRAVRLADRADAAFLHATKDGRYEAMPADWWTAGFWPGMLLLLFQRTSHERFLDIEKEAENKLVETLFDDRIYGLHHDMGFQFQPTAVARYKLTAAPDARRRTLLATAMLMSRFNPNSGCLEAWNGQNNRGVVIVDTLMNLPLLFWAAEEFDCPRYRSVAESHADRAMAEIVRNDGSTNHIVRFDEVTGDPIEIRGGQGYAPDSCWSRGQAWALYGYALAHRYTKRGDYLGVARKIADSFLAALPNDRVPPWDFRAPDASTAPRDSSAGAIAASGLLELSTLIPSADRERYRSGAIEILQALSVVCASDPDEDAEGLLRHATGDLPLGRYIDVSLIYGDFFYLEALGKLDGKTESCW